MNKYNVLHQRNVYFVDIDKYMYRGYVETTIECNEQVESIEYHIGGLDVESVEVDYDKYTHAQYSQGTIDLDAFKQDYDPNFYRKTAEVPALTVHLKEFRKDIKIRIIYRTKKENVSICFFNKDMHKECVAQNLNARAHFIFPHLVSETGYSFDLLYIVPSNYTVVSPGKFTGSVEQKDMSIYSYNLHYVLPGNINFAVGTFDYVEIVSGDDTKTLSFPARHSKSKMIFKESAKEVVGDVLGCIRFIEMFLGIEYPPISILFTHLPICLVVGQNTAIANAALLPWGKSIDQNFAFREAVATILASQFFLNLRDSGYIKVGITGYLEDQCIRHFFGNNEMLLRLKKERDFVVKNDVRELCLDDSRRTEFSMSQSFFKLKSKLFIHILESNLSEAFMQKILLSLRSKKQIKTDGFIKTIRNIAGKDMTQFFGTYVSKPGTVIFSCAFQIDQKKNKVTFNIKQRPTSVMEHANKRFSGSVCIRAFEIEGIFEHSYNLAKNELVFYYHTRTKKTKKKEAEPIMPLLWIRIDPKNEYMAGIELNQPDFMFIEALLHEKSVVGQYEALRALEKKPSEHTCNALERVLNDTHLFYKIRIEAAFVLSQVFLENYDGYQKTIQFFVKKYCLQGSTIIKPNDFSNFSHYFMQVGLIRAISLAFPLRQRVFNEKEVVVRDVAIAFINNILLYNDNDSNAYDDTHYISNAIESLSLPLCSQSFSRAGMKKERELGVNFGDEFLMKTPREPAVVSSQIRITDKFRKALTLSLELVEKVRGFDLILPSVFNKVTTACLSTLERLQCYGYVEMDKEVLLQYTHTNNYIDVRLMAFELLLIQRDADVMQHVFRALEHDHYVVKLHIILSIKNLLSSSVVDFHEFFAQFKHKFYDLLSIFRMEFVLFEHLTEVILFAEKKGKDVRDIEEVAHHEFSDEEVEKESSRQSIGKREAMSTVIRLKREYFGGEPRMESSPRDSVVRLQVPKKQARKDRFTQEFERKVASQGSQSDVGARKRAVLAAMMEHESSSKVDDFILENRTSNDFFAFEPRTLREIHAASFSEKSPTLFLVYASLVFVMTFDKVGSKAYAHAKTCMQLLESLVVDFGDKDHFVEMTNERKGTLARIVDSIIQDSNAEVFLEDVDHRRLKLTRYVDIVRQPYSLLGVKGKLEGGMYLNYDVACNELQRIFVNCLVFNHRDSEIYALALRFLAKVRSALGMKNNTEGTDFIQMVTLEHFESSDTVALNRIVEAILGALESVKETSHFVKKTDYAPAKVKRSMYLEKMKKKTSFLMYVSLGHFVDDFRTIVDNCAQHGTAQHQRDCRSMCLHFRKWISQYFGEEVGRICFAKMPPSFRRDR
jgi:hypothetical protein